MKARRLYKFGAFSVDAAAKVVVRDGEALHLTRKAVETLLVLLENCGEVVTKEEVMGEVWPDRVVDEANLKQNIAVVRRTLAIDPGDPGYIETFPRRGYRIIGPVELVEVNGSQHLPAAPPAAVAEVAAGPAKRRFPLWLAAAGAAVCGLAGWAWLTLRQPAQQASDFRVVPVTRLAGKEFQPAVSPDGAKVAFAWIPEGSGAVGIRVQIRGDANPRTVGGPGGRSLCPAWSPDGESLAYLQTGGSATTVLISNLDTGARRTVATLPNSDFGYDDRRLDWSPDGRWLAASTSDSQETPFGLVLIDLHTGERRSLTRTQDSVGGDIDPRFSPDGRFLSFVRLIHRSNQELYVVPVGGGAPLQITRDGKQVSGQDWAPDGKSILFSSDRGGSFRLWRVKPLASKPAETLQSIAIYGEFPMQLSLARKSPALVYTVLQQDRDVWRFDLQQKGWTRIIASSGQDASPQYSPAGDRICFRSDRSGEDQLWVSGADGSNPAPVTRSGLWPSVGHWSPDGESIVFNNARTGEIFVAKLGAGGGWSSGSIGVRGVHPVFSADGEWIYAGSGNSVIRIPARGGASSEVVHTTALSLGASTAGDSLYFMREPFGTAVWAVSLSSSKLTKVVEGVVPSCTSCWALAPDGIYYLSSHPQSLDEQRIVFHDFRTGKERTVTAYPEPLPPLGSGPFSLSPDGRYLLCVRLGPANSDLMQVDRFPE